MTVEEKLKKEGFKKGCKFIDLVNAYEFTYSGLDENVGKRQYSENIQVYAKVDTNSLGNKCARVIDKGRIAKITKISNPTDGIFDGITSGSLVKLVDIKHPKIKDGFIYKVNEITKEGPDFFRVEFDGGIIIHLGRKNIIDLKSSVLNYATPPGQYVRIKNGDGVVKRGEKYQVLSIGAIGSSFTLQLTGLPHKTYHLFFQCTSSDYEHISKETAYDNPQKGETPRIKIGSLIRLNPNIVNKYQLGGDQYRVSDFAKSVSTDYILSLRGREDIIVECGNEDFGILSLEYAEFKIGDTIIGKDSASLRYTITKENTKWTVVGYRSSGGLKVVHRDTLSEYDPDKPPEEWLSVFDLYFMRSGENILVGNKKKEPIKEDTINHNKKEENVKGIIKVQGSNFKIRSAVITGRIGIKSPRSKIRVGSNDSYNQTRFIPCKA